MKKITTDMNKDGISYKLIFKHDENEKIKEVMQKPNWKEIGPETHVSGFHIFRDDPNKIIMTIITLELNGKKGLTRIIISRFLIFGQSGKVLVKAKNIY